MSIDDFEDGEITHDPLGVVFLGRGRKEGRNMILFHTNYVERYSNQHLSNIMLHIKNYHKNENEDRGETKKIILWYMEVWKVLL